MDAFGEIEIRASKRDGVPLRKHHLSLAEKPCIKSRYSRETCPVLDKGTGIQEDIVRHDFWIPTYVGMTKRLENSTYDTKPSWKERIQGVR